MKYYTRAIGVASVLFILSVVLMPLSANAFWDGFPFGGPGKGSEVRESKLPFKFCERTITAAGLSVKINIPSKKCDTPPPPDEDEPTLSFSATDTTIDEGDSTTLEWNSTDVDSCTASGGWSGSKALDGSQQVTPNSDTTYTLTCENDEGDVSKSVTVNVVEDEPDQDEPTLDFTVTDNSINEGESTTLEWNSTDADTCTASNGWSGSKALDGSQQVTPTATTTYTLECENEEGEVSKSVTVNVTPDEPNAPTLDLTADPETVNEGNSSLLEWNSTDADTCEASNGWSGSKALDGSQQVTPTATTTYTLVCVGDGGTTTESVTVGFIPDEEPAPEGKLLITEVLYDLTTTTEQGVETANEWVEIYNGTNSSINLSNYAIADASSTDQLPSITLPAGSYAVIVGSSTTASFWDIPNEAIVVQLANVTIGNGLANGGDMVSLFDEVASTTIDAVSWGTNTTAFSPSVSTVTANSGHSIAREDNQVDTNTAGDWEERATPTPGE